MIAPDDKSMQGRAVALAIQVDEFLDDRNRLAIVILNVVKNPCNLPLL